MFGVLFTYKVAIFPFPAVFISASSEVPAMILVEVEKNIISNIVSILEIAQTKYKAIAIINEPTEHTHQLNFTKSKNAVAGYCSLRFQSVTEMYTFIQNEIKNKE